jgi:PHD/YefM family antitoxin component YafN of YafNO toxin-antitoxin module
MRIRRLRAAEARAEWADVLDDAEHRDTATIVKRRGRESAIVLPLTWYELHRGDEDPSTSLAPVRRASALSQNA